MLECSGLTTNQETLEKKTKDCQSWVLFVHQKETDQYTSHSNQMSSQTCEKCVGYENNIKQNVLLATQQILAERTGIGKGDVAQRSPTTTATQSEAGSWRLSNGHGSQHEIPMSDTKYPLVTVYEMKWRSWGAEVVPV